MNYVIRAAKPGDLQSIYEMAKLTGGGFTNLPPDRAALKNKLERAEASFAKDTETLADELFGEVAADEAAGAGDEDVFASEGSHGDVIARRRAPV